MKGTKKFSSSIPDLATGRASDNIERELTRMIVTLELAPGAAMSEAYLAKQLGCGRTPLREALQRLAQSYLVVSQPGRGISIATLDVVAFVELMETVSSVGVISARLACQLITDEQLRELEEVVSQAEAADSEGDFLAVGELDFKFHCMIAQMAHNRYLEEIIVRLQRLALRYSWVVWRRQGTASASFVEHRRIITALRNRDSVEAERSVSDHWHSAWERMTPVLRTSTSSNPTLV